VLQAAGGEEAFGIASDLALEIALLVTDVVMPGMSGDELARQLRETRPNLPVLFVSGHTFDYPIGEFLPKPFTAFELCERAARLIRPVARVAGV
jgi:FixJ family two-component response regulator